MRPLAFLLVACSSAALAVWACGGDSSPAAPAADASADVAVEAHVDSGGIVVLDGSVRSCTLGNGGDPVALCTQKAILKSERSAAFVKALGVVASWDSKTFQPDTSDAGAPLHDVRDDIAFASTIVSYDVSARRYGDTEINVDLDDVLVAMATNIENQLASPPSGYDGDVYLRLRNVAGGLRTINENDHANKIDAIADPYGHALYATYLQTISAGDSVLGTPSGGAVAYDAAAVATGALALLDMAVRHQADDPTNAAKWVAAAKQSFDHLFSRARDPVTRLFYRSLVTSSDPGRDALAPVDALPSDAQLTEVQAAVMLSLARANEIRLANPTLLAPFTTVDTIDRVDQIFQAMGAAGLWDASDRGYFEGWLPSQSALLTNKPTRANAMMFGAVHRKFIDAPPRDAGPTSPEVVQVKGLRALLIQQLPEHSSLLSVVQDQSAYLRASTRDYQLATTLVLGDAGDGGEAGAAPGPTEPRAASYTAAATAAALDALNEQLYGAP